MVKVSREVVLLFRAADERDALFAAEAVRDGEDEADARFDALDAVLVLCARGS